MVILFGTIVVSFQLESQIYLIDQVEKRTLNTLARFQRRLKLSNEPAVEKNEIAELIAKFNKDFIDRLKIISVRLWFMRFSIWLFLLVSVVFTVDAGWTYSFSPIPIYSAIAILLILAFSILTFIKK